MGFRPPLRRGSENGVAELQPADRSGRRSDRRPEGGLKKTSAQAFGRLSDLRNRVVDIVLGLGFR